MKTPEGLATALAERLNSVVPDGIVITASDGSIGPEVNGEFLGGTDFKEWVGEGEIFDPGDGDAVLAALHAIQDAVVRVLRSQWPTDGGELPEPGVEVRENRLLMWYGDETDPVVRLEPIELADV